jgi:hypothetical protein
VQICQRRVLNWSEHYAVVQFERFLMLGQMLELNSLLSANSRQGSFPRLAPSTNPNVGLYDVGRIRPVGRVIVLGLGELTGLLGTLLLGRCESDGSIAGSQG